MSEIHQISTKFDNF